MLLGCVSTEIFILGMAGGCQTFLMGGCMELVCQAEQHHILLAISVQLGRH